VTPDPVDFARRDPSTIVAIAFLWGPACLIVGLLIGSPDAIFISLFVAAIPYLGVMVWPFVVAFREGRHRTRIFLVIGIAAFLAFASALSWPGLEH
jgi:hypothetical protein